MACKIHTSQQGHNCVLCNAENEKTVIVGWWLNGATYKHIASKYKTTEGRIKIIVMEWLKGRSESDYQKTPRPKLLPKIPD